MRTPKETPVVPSTLLRHTLGCRVHPGSETEDSDTLFGTRVRVSRDSELKE